VSFPIKILSVVTAKSNIDITIIKDDLTNVSKSIKISTLSTENMIASENELFMIRCEFSDEKI
jgi:hypothetical protein